MRSSTVIIVAAALLGLLGCQKKSTVQVENLFSRVHIENVYWGDVYIGSNLSPRHISDVVEVHARDAKLPKSQRIYFNKGGDKSVSYYTGESFELKEGEDLLIQLTDTTAYFESAN